jgi:septin family protein
MVVGTCSPDRSLMASRTTLTLDTTGESGLGKTTLINTLFATEICTPRNYKQRWAHPVLSVYIC